MARASDPMAAWKARMQPTKQAESTFQSIRKLLETCAGESLTAQTQKFPPKYVLTVSAVPRRRGETFAVVAAVGESVYFDLLPSQRETQRRLRALFKGCDYMAGEGFDLIGDQTRRLPQIEAEIQSAHAELAGSTASKPKRAGDRKMQGRSVPPAQHWSSNAAWVGPDLTPVHRLPHLTKDAVFARCTLEVDLARTKGVGIREVRERKTTGLLEFNPLGGRGKNVAPSIVAIHLVGFDRRPWSFRLTRCGKKQFMPLFVGDSFSDQQEASAGLLEQWPIIRVDVTALLKWEEDSAIRLALGPAFEVLPDDDDEEAADRDV